ncbi:hypothetical protein FNV43_RR22923 [Rhamnella rubrinervis]|uniref:Uncharacterized protein n=1 Tax=Rhamnella rubrinervis TaxID=2594499 RepID=A0A8K0DSE9_9ROSA|nr:hypothetical protein FNV43_RR22923 [Rhamnella rubrinervis]
MVFRLPGVVPAKLKRSLSNSKKSDSSGVNVPKGHLAVYVGDTEKKRFVVPLSLLNHPSFQELLIQAEKNLDLNLQWAVSQFPAEKMSSSILFLT